MPRLCSHDICRHLWSVRDVSCYGKNTKFESHQSCFYAEDRPTWIRVVRAEPTRNADPQLFRWVYRERTLYKKFKAPAFYTINVLEALTSDYGNELWSGRICAAHRNRARKEPLTSCAVLLERVQRSKVEALAAFFIIKASIETKIFHQPLIDLALQGLLPKTEMPILQIRQLSHDIMGKHPPESNEWKMARAYSLYANIFHNRDASWMTPFSEFVTYMNATFPSAENVLKRNATKILLKDTLSDAKNEVLAGFMRLKAEIGLTYDPNRNTQRRCPNLQDGRFPQNAASSTCPSISDRLTTASNRTFSAVTR